MPEQRPVRFLTIPQVAEALATSEAQINAILKRSDLVAIKLGGGVSGESSGRSWRSSSPGRMRRCGLAVLDGPVAEAIGQRLA